MAISIKHKFQSAKGDSADTSLVRPSNWNDTHDIEMSGNSLIGKANAGTGPATEISLGTNMEFSGGNLQVKANAFATSSDLTTLSNTVATKMRKIGTGVALPVADEGPIWHDDYGCVMTWQAFTANGAAYTGYASEDIGMPKVDAQSTARRGHLKRNGGSVSKTTYAALWAWAQHNGRVVTLGSWAAGAFVFADNGDGTFKLPDTRGYFERLASDGSSVDSGRALGSAQADDVKGHNHPGTGLTFVGTALPAHAHSFTVYRPSGTNAGTFTGSSVNTGDPWTNSTSSVSAGTPSGTISGNTGNNTGTESRPVNVALLGIIKF